MRIRFDSIGVEFTVAEFLRMMAGGVAIMAAMAGLFIAASIIG